MRPDSAVFGLVALDLSALRDWSVCLDWALADSAAGLCSYPEINVK